MTKDYRVDIRVRNNWLLTRIEAAGYPTLSAFSRALGIKNPNFLSYLVNLKRPAVRKNGNWTSTVLRMAELLRCLPEDLFPPQHVHKALKKSTGTLQLGADEIPALLGNMPSLAPSAEDGMERDEAVQLVHNMLDELPPRCRTVLMHRYGLNGDGDGKTFEETSHEVGDVSRERVRQLEQKAFRLLQHPSRSKSLKDALRTIAREDA